MEDQKTAVSHSRHPAPGMRHELREKPFEIDFGERCPENHKNIVMHLNFIVLR
jgi:hypothetical protein